MAVKALHLANQNLTTSLFIFEIIAFNNNHNFKRKMKVSATALILFLVAFLANFSQSINLEQNAAELAARSPLEFWRFQNGEFGMSYEQLVPIQAAQDELVVAARELIVKTIRCIAFGEECDRTKKKAKQDKKDDKDEKAEK